MIEKGEHWQRRGGVEIGVDVSDAGAWAATAPCRLRRPAGATGPDWFAASNRPEGQAALLICREACPVRATCLAWAVRTRQQWGIWGGIPETQLATLVRQAKNGRPLRDVVLDALGAEVQTTPDGHTRSHAA